jgi:large subunit ribosomal protein L30
MLRIKLVKSTIGHNPRNRATVHALGLKRPHQVVEHADTPTIRGMIRHVHPLLSVEVVPDTPATEATPKAAKTPKAKPAEAVAAPVEVEADAEAKPKAKRTKKATDETSEETK